MQGWQEMIDIIKEHSGDRKTLRVFISTLTEKAVLSGKPSKTAVARHALVFGELAKLYKTGLVDPLDKPATRKHTYERIL